MAALFTYPGSRGQITVRHQQNDRVGIFCGLDWSLHLTAEEADSLETELRAIREAREAAAPMAEAA